ncbi:MAG: hypothetical protein ACRDZQ_00590 [Acidimicrobiales bacterium]
MFRQSANDFTSEIATHPTELATHSTGNPTVDTIRRFGARASAAIVLWGLAGIGIILASPPAFAASSTLSSGQQLTGGQELVNGSYTLIMQTDGNLVEYASGSAIWQSHTSGEAGNYAIMQTDGNFVIYSSGGVWRWQTATNGYSGSYLNLGGDGNFVVYSRGGTPEWAKSWTESVSGAQTYARDQFFHYGWSVSAQYTYLNQLWTAESNWQWNLCYGGGTYPSCNYTGLAYGIPQANPGSDLASSGPDWATDGLTQVQWGLAYISSRYGTPQAAWNHEVKYGWYVPYGEQPATNRSTPAGATNSSR